MESTFLTHDDENTLIFIFVTTSINYTEQSEQGTEIYKQHLKWTYVKRETAMFARACHTMLA